jgi:hypothetical protein
VVSPQRGFDVGIFKLPFAVFFFSASLSRAKRIRVILRTYPEIQLGYADKAMKPEQVR